MPPVEVLPPPSARKYWTRREIAEYLTDRLTEHAPMAGAPGRQGRALLTWVREVQYRRPYAKTNWERRGYPARNGDRYTCAGTRRRPTP